MGRKACACATSRSRLSCEGGVLLSSATFLVLTSCRVHCALEGSLNCPNEEARRLAFSLTVYHHSAFMCAAEEALRFSNHVTASTVPRRLRCFLLLMFVFVSLSACSSSRTREVCAKASVNNNKRQPLGSQGEATRNTRGDAHTHKVMQVGFQEYVQTSPSKQP